MKTVMFGFTLVITEGISHAMDDDSNKSYSKEICKGSPLPLPLLVMHRFMVSDQETGLDQQCPIRMYLFIGEIKIPYKDFGVLTSTSYS